MGFVEGVRTPYQANVDTIANGCLVTAYQQYCCAGWIKRKKNAQLVPSVSNAKFLHVRIGRPLQSVNVRAAKADPLKTQEFDAIQHRLL